MRFRVSQGGVGRMFSIIQINTYINATVVCSVFIQDFFCFFSLGSMLPTPKFLKDAFLQIKGEDRGKVF